MNQNNELLISLFKDEEDKIEFFNRQENFEKSIIISAIENKEKLELIKELKTKELIEILEYYDPDEAVDIIQLFDEKKQVKIISKLNKETKEKVDFLLRFTPESAAGIMSLNYILINEGTSKKEITEKIKKHLKLGKKEPSIFIINDFGHFLGELRISKLLYKTNEEIYKKIVELPTIIFNEHQNEVITIFKENKKEKVVVLDETQRIMGVIHAKDIFKAIENENSDDFFGLAGLHKDEDISDKATTKVKFRLKWLIINLLTTFIGAFIVNLYETTIAQFVIIAAFIPIIAGMGGNAGIQTTAILIRSLALKKIETNSIKNIISNEIFAGIINGFIVGIMVTAIAYLFNQNILFGLIAGISVILNIIIGTIFGTIIPLILKSAGYDPASSSSVFVTTMTDILGFLIFLGLATKFLI